MLHFEQDLYDPEPWTFRKVDRKHLESSELWYWRMTEKITGTDLVRNENVLHRVKEDRTVLHAINTES